MSIRLLWAWRHNRPIIHTAVDDLESFIWLLSWALVHILKKYGGKDIGIFEMEKALSSKDLGSNTLKEGALLHFWPDVVFGNLMRHWLKILMVARDDVEKHRLVLSTTTAESPARNLACDDLASLCDKVYEEVLELGFSHREEISRYSQWEGVVKAMEPSMWRPSR